MSDIAAESLAFEIDLVYTGIDRIKGLSEGWCEAGYSKYSTACSDDVVARFLGAGVEDHHICVGMSTRSKR